MTPELKLLKAESDKAYDAYLKACYALEEEKPKGESL